MRVVAWIVADTWPACVDAARAQAGPTDEVVLLHVVDDELHDAAGGAVAGLLGRGRGGGPAAAVAAVAAEQSAALLADAGDRLGRPAVAVSRHGRVEREVVAATAGADLLVMVRDGDLRPGPHSFGRAGRFVVDHVVCPVLVVPAHG